LGEEDLHQKSSGIVPKLSFITRARWAVKSLSLSPMLLFWSKPPPLLTIFLHSFDSDSPLQRVQGFYFILVPSLQSKSTHNV
jgi:hypothetical protein